MFLFSRWKLVENVEKRVLDLEPKNAEKDKKEREVNEKKEEKEDNEEDSEDYNEFDSGGESDEEQEEDNDSDREEQNVEKGKKKKKAVKDEEKELEKKRKEALLRKDATEADYVIRQCNIGFLKRNVQVLLYPPCTVFTDDVLIDENGVEVFGKNIGQGFYHIQETFRKSVGKRPAVNVDIKEDIDEFPVCPHSVLALHRRFDFSAHLQRMSVIVSCLNLGDVRGRLVENPPFEVFTKGSPEALRQLCVPSSIPASFQRTLNAYARRGLRVIALGHRVLSDGEIRRMVSSGLSEGKGEGLTAPNVPVVSLLSKLPRSSVEANLTFLGFLIMENKLRPSSLPTIERLTNAHIKSVMVTGV
jgi:hypothetical protein